MISQKNMISEEKRAIQELQAHINKGLQLYGEDSDHYFSNYPEAIVNGYLVREDRVRNGTFRGCDSS